MYRKFGTGDYDSLWSRPKADGRDPRQQLISWWEKEYCAKRMKLAVIGKDDIDTLEKWVTDRFAQVPVRTEGAPAVGPNGQRVVYEEMPTDPARMGVSRTISMACIQRIGQTLILFTRWSPLPSPCEMTEVSRSASLFPISSICISQR